MQILVSWQLATLQKINLFKPIFLKHFEHKPRLFLICCLCLIIVLKIWHFANLENQINVLINFRMIIKFWNLFHYLCFHLVRCGYWLFCFRLSDVCLTRSIITLSMTTSSKTFESLILIAKKSRKYFITLFW